MRQIVLIGTWHHFQLPGGPESASFGMFVEDIFSQHRVAAIAEEMSEDALAENGVTQSVGHQIALARGLAHRYCDPSRNKRVVMYVLQESDIRKTGFLQSWEPGRIESEIRSSHAIRERYWLDRLSELDIWPALFVCGANHVSYFRDLLEKQGFEVTVAADDWEPCSASMTDTA